MDISLVKKLIGFIALICILINVQGCANAAFSSAEALYDRHEIQKKLNDHYQSIKVYRKIYLDNDQYKNTHINITIFNQKILLTGFVSTKKQKENINNIVIKATNIKKVYNFIVIGPTPSILTRLSDAFITAKIRSQFLLEDELNPENIKVITENGTVFLMGIVSPKEAQIAVNIARTTNGVQNVVKIFSYIHITQTFEE